MAETFTVTQTTTPNADVRPDDIVTTTVTITNNSTTTAATNVSFLEDLQGMTLSGNVNVSPIAFNNAYNLIGNTTLTVNAANGLLANDTEPLGTNGILLDTGTVLQIGGVSVTDGFIVDTAGGAVTLNDDGSFAYRPDAGFTGTDSFTYQLRDTGLNGIAGDATT
jgi:hypothetical protein